MATKTIARNRVAFIQALFARATNGKLYTLDNGFTGESIPTPFTHTLNSVLSGLGRLRQDGPTHYTVRYHSNHWFTFEAPIIEPIRPGWRSPQVVS